MNEKQLAEALVDGNKVVMGSSSGRCYLVYLDESMVDASVVLDPPRYHCVYEEVPPSIVMKAVCNRNLFPHPQALVVEFLDHMVRVLGSDYLIALVNRLDLRVGFLSPVDNETVVQAAAQLAVDEFVKSHIS